MAYPKRVWNLMTRRYSALWSVHELEREFVVSHVNGQIIAHVYFWRIRDDNHKVHGITRDQALRLAQSLAQLQETLSNTSNI